LESVSLSVKDACGRLFFVFASNEESE